MNKISSHPSGARLEFNNIQKSFGDTVSVEAVMLADRIALMASSPRGYIAEILDIELDRPRDPDNPAFRAIQQQLDRFLEHETLLAEHIPAPGSTDLKS